MLVGLLRVKPEMGEFEKHLGRVGWEGIGDDSVVEMDVKREKGAAVLIMKC